MSAADDLRLLPHGVARTATVDANGEVWWRSGDAETAVNGLADAGLVILGLDLREYSGSTRKVLPVRRELPPLPVRHDPTLDQHDDTVRPA
jgi:hypothetical protein